MYALNFHTRSNGTCPYDDSVKAVVRSGKLKEAAKIRAIVDRLKQSGTRELVRMRRAEKMNDVWQLRVDGHRVFYFWHAEAHCYVILNGFRK